MKFACLISKIRISYVFAKEEYYACILSLLKNIQLYNLSVYYGMGDNSKLAGEAKASSREPWSDCYEPKKLFHIIQDNWHGSFWLHGKLKGHNRRAL